MHVPFFRIFYTTTFTILILLLTALLLITPGDHVYQAFKKKQFYNIFIVAGASLLTLLIAAFIFASRLYTTRSILAAIPRELNISEKGNSNWVPRQVRRLVREDLQRTVRISWIGRPRDISRVREELQKRKGANPRPSTGLLAAEKHLESASSGVEPPVWGTISHPGWSSPESIDLPNLHLPPIILELPHLIEAKAVSLAPTPKVSQHNAGLGSAQGEPDEIQLAAPSPLATSFLQRPATMSLREYLTHLSSLGLINPPSLAVVFLARYEQARFSKRVISEKDLRTLMSIFAEILRGMKNLSPEMLEQLRTAEEAEATTIDAQEAEEAEAQWLAYNSDGAQDADIDKDGKRRTSLETTSTVAHTPLPVPARSSTSFSSTASRLPRSDGPPNGSVRRGLRTPSIASIRPAQSLRSKASSVLTGRSSGRSVIHLAEEREPLDLPYVIDGAG